MLKWIDREEFLNTCHFSRDPKKKKRHVKNVGARSLGIKHSKWPRFRSLLVGHYGWSIASALLVVVGDKRKNVSVILDEVGKTSLSWLTKQFKFYFRCCGKVSERFNVRSDMTWLQVTKITLTVLRKINLKRCENRSRPKRLLWKPRQERMVTCTGVVSVEIKRYGCIQIKFWSCKHQDLC